MADRGRMTADQVRRAVYTRFSDRYAVVFEVASAGHERWRGKHQRRIDVLLVRRSPLSQPTAAQAAIRRAADRVVATAAPAEPDALFPAPSPPTSALPAGPVPAGDDGGIDRLALEIKVSRADFFQDVRDPGKQAPWRELAHRHAYVVPEGLVQLAEVPNSSGLIVVRDDGGWRSCEWARKAPRVQVARPLPVAIVLDAFHRWGRAEARAKGYVGADVDADGSEAMRLELARLRHQVELLGGKVDRAQDAVAAWKRRYAALDPPPCSTCGQPLRPARRGVDEVGYLRWEHPAAAEEACQAERHRRALAAHLRKPEDKRWGFHVPGPEPAYPGDPERPEVAA